MIRIFDHNHDQIKRFSIISKNRLNIYAHQKFGIQIIKYTENSNINPPRLYDVDHDGVDYLGGVYFCTLYIPIHQTKVVFRIYEDFSESLYTDYMVEYNDGNILSDSQKHYNDVMMNKNMPAYEDISKSVIPSSDYDSRELIKKLLLDLNKIFVNKGTKDSVENFFRFLGYEDYTDRRLELTDVLDSNQEKTGYYLALYKYYKQIYDKEFDENNLPNVEMNIFNIDDFRESLVHAIEVANKYFTTEEQLIDVVNIQFNANHPKFDSIVSRNRKHFQYDALYFRHDVKINAKTFDEYERFPKFHVKDTAIVDLNLPKHEIKYFMNDDLISEITTLEYFRITDEIFEDTEILPSQMNDIRRGFGAILHLSVKIPQTTLSSRRWVSTEFFKYEETEYQPNYDNIDFSENIYMYPGSTYKSIILEHDLDLRGGLRFLDNESGNEMIAVPQADYFMYVENGDIYTQVSLNTPVTDYASATNLDIHDEDFLVDGHIIPAGKHIVMQIMGLHRYQLHYPNQLSTDYGPVDNQYRFYHEVVEVPKITTPLVEMNSDDEISYQVAVFKNGVYRFLVNVYDTLGSRETYFYDFVMQQENVRIDVDVFTSKNLTPLNDVNEIYQDTTTPNLSLTPVRLEIPVGATTVVLNSYQLYQEDVPTNLSEYYDIDTPLMVERWLDKRQVRQFEKFNLNYRLTDVTESIPTCLIDSFLDIMVLPKNVADEDLYVEIYDPYTATRMVSLEELNEAMSPLDNLFVSYGEVFEHNYTTNEDISIGDYWIIIGMLSGFNLSNVHIYIKRNDTYIKIAEVEGFYESKQPLYYDIPMAVTQEDVTEYYVSDTGLYAYVKQQNDTIETIHCIKSLFPHLTKMRDYHDSYGLKLNDVVFASVSPKYIDYPFENSWEVQDTFSHEILKSSQTRTLIYRYKLKNIIDILLKFYLTGFDETFEHQKLLQSVQSYQ